MFRTELPIAPATDQLARAARVLTMGSCFADSIGSRLAATKVDTLVNPFGTVFQPLALGRLLRAAAGEDVDWQQHVVEARGRWQSYDLHGSIGADSPVALLQTIQELVQRTGEFLRAADAVLLTLGTAWAYRLRETGELVSNCHKQPADLFVRELLTPDEIINSLAETHAYLRRINPKLRFVLTVSPVRHLKDTLPLNSVSKSVLRVATHFVSDLLPDVAYFPAYELLVDDLRDYRFYGADMLHPSEVAQDYVWDKFARTHFDAEFGRFRKEWAAVRQSMEHRPLHAGAPEHRQFLESVLEKLEELRSRQVEVAAELREVRTRLAALPLPRQLEMVAAREDDEERVDIGEGAAVVATPLPGPSAESAQVLAESRLPRLSPEEFRAQRASRSERGRRDGRGRGQRELAAENEQFQAARSSASDEPALPLAELSGASEVAAAPLSSTPPAPAAAAPGAAGADEEPAKKKKRRSRGGAKRTARKNALRLGTGGEILPESEPAIAAPAETTGPAAVEQLRLSQDSEKMTVTANSAAAKRGGRRNEPDRAPRAELRAVSEAQGATGLLADAETSPLSPAAPGDTDATPPGALGETKPSPSNSRSRNNRGARRPNAGGDPGADAVGQAEAPSAPSVDGTRPFAGAAPTTPAVEKRNQAEEQRAAAETAAVQTAPGEAASVAAQGGTRRPNRTKRAVSAARAEKPAVDTPVVPVPDALQVRTQVAAGRMTGSSATLVAPTAPLTKAPAAKKVAIASKTAGKPRATRAAPAAVPTPAPAAKLRPAAKPKPTAAAKPAEPGTPAAQPKPAAKAKAAGPKPSAKKAVAEPAAARPKPPKKPAKPA